MARKATPLFLARRSYRRHRLMDAARLLPILGLVLIFLPGLWHPHGAGRAETASALIYLFGTWAVLIALAAALARGLAPALDAEDEAEGSVPRDEGTS
ncbi:hypothetical protein [Rhodobacter lacus]|uniref:Uncharacterized protein n=1 Tax=Rhodobacter lacus TaxID=1641972 RepID=A0ABW5A766_9RHOB